MVGCLPAENGPIFEQEWIDGVQLIQTTSPVVDYPDDVDTVALGEALLQFLGTARPGMTALIFTSASMACSEVRSR